MEENKMDLRALLCEDLIFPDIHVSNQEALFDFIAEKFEKMGIVKESFRQALGEREKNYPTGLFMEHISIAIPHADKEHIREPAVAVVKLEKPVKFHSMEDADKTVDATVVIFLTFTQEGTNVELLPQILKFFTDEKKTKKFLASGTREEMLRLLCQ